MVHDIPYDNAAFLAGRNKLISALNANLATFGLTVADMIPQPTIHR